jgi:hypothetical protein
VICVKVCGRVSNRPGQGRVLAVDRTPDGDADHVGEAAASERRLPREDPGTEVSSSRADSRAGAAAANEASGGQTEAKPGEKAAELTRPSINQGRGETTSEAAKPVEEENSEQAPDVSADEGRPRYAFKTGGKPLREHIDPVGAESSQQPPEGRKEAFERTIRGKDAPWSDGVDTFDDLPTGEKLAEPDEEKRSPVDKFRVDVHKNFSTISSDASKIVDKATKILLPRPTGHAETRTDSGPVVIDAQHPGVDTGSAVSALLAVGIVGSEIARWGIRKIRKGD